jgi:hypothetical protein
MIFGMVDPGVAGYHQNKALHKYTNTRLRFPHQMPAGSMEIKTTTTIHIILIDLSLRK